MALSGNSGRRVLRHAGANKGQDWRGGQVHIYSAFTLIWRLPRPRSGVRQVRR